MNADEIAALLQVSTDSIHAVRAVSGGDICHALRVATHDGPLFLKTQVPTFAAAFAAEADALQKIAATGAVRVPAVRGSGNNERVSWLALEWLDLLPTDASGAVALGKSLAAMHRVSAQQHGWHQANFIGTSVQPNEPSASWSDFFVQARLRPQLTYLRDVPAAKPLIDPVERAIAEVPTAFAGHAPQPSLLHGDLWQGNCAVLASGEPVVFDPAAYFGDRETDLAMTELFGGFSREFYAAYNDAWPLDDGYVQRRDWYQLYHILNHVTAFAGAYVGQAQRLLARLIAQ